MARVGVKTLPPLGYQCESTSVPPTAASSPNVFEDLYPGSRVRHRQSAPERASCRGKMTSISGKSDGNFPLPSSFYRVCAGHLHTPNSRPVPRDWPRTNHTRTRRMPRRMALGGAVPSPRPRTSVGAWHLIRSPEPSPVDAHEVRAERQRGTESPLDCACLRWK
jgi:hypothetical protein